MNRFENDRKITPNKPGVIILGGHIQGYGIARIFGENNIPVVLIDNEKHNITKYSRYCYGSYRAGYDTTIKLLLSGDMQKNYQNWLIIPTDDYYVKLLSINLDELSKNYHVTIDNWESIQKFYNKRLSYKLALEQGIAIPNTILPESSKHLLEQIEGITYPCIIKPAVMKDFYAVFKKKVLLCKNLSELEANYSRVKDHFAPEDLIIQEVIPGNSENQYSVGIFFDRDKTYNHLVARRRRQHPPDFGNATTYAETVQIPELLIYAESILKAAGFSGIAEVEFKYDYRDKQYKFLEVNPRLWKWHLIAEPAGVPFLLSLYSFYIKGVAIPNKLYASCAWQDIVTDLPVQMVMKYHKIYSTPDKQPTIHAVFNRKDMVPFGVQLASIPYFLFTRN